LAGATANGGGGVIRLAGGAGDIVLDEATAEVTVGGGVSIDTLLAVVVPRGFFVPVTPGTRFVTLGGAVASDIHGKNHHVDGSIGDHVVSIELMLADGQQVTVSPSARPDVFWATVGGMGLTGVIVSVRLRLLRIETSRMLVDTHRIADLDALFAAMADDDDFRYSVAWIDVMATGSNLGRSVLTRGDHAKRSDLTGRASAAPLAYSPRQLLTVPPLVPAPGVLNHLTVAAFNELWYRKAPRNKVGGVHSIGGFFHPLDGVGAWNRLYGRAGLVQYQFVVPMGAEEVMRSVIEQLAASGAPSFLAVLKRFGPGNAAPLSFPQPGWTLALDVPAGARHLGELLHRLDETVLDAGGRHYLSKDAHATAATIRRGYPRLTEWQVVRQGIDPTGVWTSDQARRLQLV
jgi:decaprenylphospho-beta-D-ribofuranose 2-oxidase